MATNATDGRIARCSYRPEEEQRFATGSRRGCFPGEAATHIGAFDRAGPRDFGARTEDVLCQPPARLRIIGWRKSGRGLADVGLPSSAARSALRAARGVTAAPAIRWVAARSGTGPDGSG